MNKKKIVIGLGNKGFEYEETRHNIGFMVIDRLIEKLDIVEKKDNRYFKCRKAVCGDIDVYLVKPETYMNLSGIAVNEIVDELDVSINDILVICDDIDLSLGTIRFRPKGSAGTHNGLKSIEFELGTQEYPRLRLGVSNNHNGNLSDYVLSPFEHKELEILHRVIDKATHVVIDFFDKDFEFLMNKYNKN